MVNWDSWTRNSVDPKFAAPVEASIVQNAALVGYRVGPYRSGVFDPRRNDLLVPEVPSIVSTIARIRETITAHNLPEWLDEFPWLTGYLGDSQSPVWFVGENPSLSAVRRIDGREPAKTENLQWNCTPGDWLLREALTEAGLKTGDPSANSGWRCYLTNAVKAPAVVGDRNAGKTAVSMRKEAEIWLPVLQHEIDSGSPSVLVAVGGQSHKLLGYMRQLGLRTPEITRINHYSYVMSRPDRKAGLGPRDLARITSFKTSILDLARRYGS